jgi:hypothetical protein
MTPESWNSSLIGNGRDRSKDIRIMRVSGSWGRIKGVEEGEEDIHGAII